MPIQLTAAFNPGDVDPNKTYSQAKIREYAVSILEKKISLWVQLGNTVNTVWEPGAAATEKGFSITGQDFLDIAGEDPQQGEDIYTATSRILYEYLLDKGYYAGTIV